MQSAHELTTKGEQRKLLEIEKEVDALAAELWGVTPKELEQIQRALKED